MFSNAMYHPTCNEEPTPDDNLKKEKHSHELTAYILPFNYLCQRNDETKEVDVACNINSIPSYKQNN